MNRGLSLIFVAASLIVLAGCTISGGGGGGGGGFSPPATSVSALAPSNEPGPLATGVLDPGETRFYRVTVSSSVANASDIIYYDLDVGADESQNGANSVAMRLYNTSGQVLASSVSHAGYTDGTFAELTLSNVSDVETLGINIAWPCYGPCVIEASGFGTRYIRLENISDFAQNFAFYSYGLAFQDTNEPANDNAGSPVPVSGFDKGAIETIGDDDYYVSEKTGELSFLSGSATELELRARVTRNGTPLVTLPPGGSYSAQIGDEIHVYSNSGWAGSAAASLYSLEFPAP